MGAYAFRGSNANQTVAPTAGHAEPLWFSAAALSAPKCTRVTAA